MPSPIGIQTNVGAIMVQRHLATTSRELTRSVGRLSSGYRLLSAADDAAGMAVSEGLQATIRGLRQAQRNANDAVAVLQTAEGAFQALTDILIRMRELSVQSANDTLTDTERSYLDTEYQLLLNEIDRISQVTEYNGVQLLNGTAGDGTGTLTFQIGVRNSDNDRLVFKLNPQSPIDIGIAFTGVDTLDNSQSSIDAIDFALSNLSTDRAALGSMINRLTAAIDNLGVATENLQEALAQVRDVDITHENSVFVGKQVLMQAGVAMLSQASQIPSLALQLLQR